MEFFEILHAKFLEEWEDHLFHRRVFFHWGTKSQLALWGFIRNPVLSIKSLGEIGFWEHDTEASKMQGRARGRKAERRTYHINPYHHITITPWNLEDIYWMWQKLHARKSAQGQSARGPILPKSKRNCRQPPYDVPMISCSWSLQWKFRCRTRPKVNASQNGSYPLHPKKAPTKHCIFFFCYDITATFCEDSTMPPRQ